MPGILVKCLVVLSGLFTVTVTTIYFILAASEPLLNDYLGIPGLRHSATVERDKNGFATFNAENRVDLARLTGFLHAQERFFQMDLLRRNSAGELAALFGKAALPHDKRIRLHRFRHRATLAFASAPEKHADILKAYAEGVNTGLEKLGVRPFEYFLLGERPKAWVPEDTYLVVYSMYLDLQREFGERDFALTTIQQHFGADMLEFLYPNGSQWDATLDNSDNPVAPILPDFSLNASIKHSQNSLAGLPPGDKIPGSNNWAVSGAMTPYASGMLADDMHLGLGTPNIWFKARFKYFENGNARDIVGVSLPGTPNIIVGSNGNVAWGFTNSYGDWSDIIKLRQQDGGYVTATGRLDFEESEETIAVAGAEDVTITVKNSIWGPVIATDNDGHEYAFRWVAHDPQGLNLNILGMESATDVYQGMAVAASAGMPAQNMVLADTQGNIAWTIAGAIPIKDQDYDARLVSDWSSKTQGWQGYLKAEAYPKIVNPEHGRLWTANARVVGGTMLNLIGDGGYALGARSQQIQSRLFEQDQFNERDFLNMQLDNEAKFLARWQQFLLNRVLGQSTHPEKQALIEAISGWSGRANPDDLGYLLVRQFRLKARDLVFEDLTAHLDTLGHQFDAGSIHKRFEPALWQLVGKQPQAHLPKRFSSWPQLFEVALSEMLQQLEQEHGNWQKLTWGEFNASRLRHPMSGFVPLLSWLTDMPELPQAGDSFMPRVDGGSFGASQRLVVAPGHEDKGILHMPASQSGHPLSPYYGRAHSAWYHGEATPLLPGKTKYTLHMLPD